MLLLNISTVGVVERTQAFGLGEGGREGEENCPKIWVGVYGMGYCAGCVVHVYKMTQNQSYQSESVRVMAYKLVAILSADGSSTLKFMITVQFPFSTTKSSG